jgi:hypothetical protein
VKGRCQQLTDSFIYTTIRMGIANSFGTIVSSACQYYCNIIRTWWCGRRDRPTSAVRFLVVEVQDTEVCSSRLVGIDQCADVVAY